MIDLSGRIAIVTGGASGIGRGISAVLAQQGAVLVIADLNEAAAQQAAAELAASTGQESHAVEVDVTSRQSVAALVETVLARSGRIDILVNNAGIVGAPGWETRPRVDDTDWEMTLSVNLRGVVNVSEAVAEVMKQQRSGKIVNIASIAGRQGGAANPPYNISKAGVISWTQGHAMELAPFDINVNAICPGLLWTPLFARPVQRNILRGEAPPRDDGDSLEDVFERQVQGRVPLKRAQTPEDVGRLAAFLASDDACNITGQAINLDGGIRAN